MASALKAESTFINLKSTIMKNFIGFSLSELHKVLLIVCVICMTSCSSETRIDTLNSDKEFAYHELQKDLAAYNTTFWIENDIPQTRSFWRRLRGYLFADAGGALLGSIFGGWGALFGAVYCSAVAGPVYAEMELLNADNNDGMKGEVCDTIIKLPFDPIPLDPQNVAPVVPVEPTFYATVSNLTVTTSGIGHMHNVILYNMDKKHSNLYNQQTNYRDMAKYITSEMKEYNYTIPVAEQNTLIQKINSSIPNDKTEIDTDIVTHLKTAYPEFTNEFSILEDFIANIERINGNVEFMKTYLDGYLQIIENSNLSESEKDLLISSLEVAANSAVLWIIE